MSTKKENISILIRQAISLAVKQAAGISVKTEEIQLKHPDNEVWGDYTSNIAMTIFSKFKRQKSKCKITEKNLKKSKKNSFNNPIKLANKIKLLLKKKDLPFIKKITSINGFINLTLKNDWLVGQFKEVIDQAENFGRSDIGNNKRIMVEFAHPNTHKAFHIGHLRNICTGEAIARILQANGYKVIRANYQGDVGLHIAKSLWAILQNLKGKNKDSKLAIKEKKFKNLDEKIKFLGKCYAAGSKAYEENPKARREIIAINQKIYDHSDEKINKLWQETRSFSLKYFNQIYKRVYSFFDRFYFESEVYEQARQVALKALEKGILVKSKGAVIFPGSKYGLHDRVFLNSQGNPTYEAKDLELFRLQNSEYHPDLIIHVVSKEQSGYFKVLFKALEKIFPESKGKEFHLEYGWVRLKEGKMSSRLGKVVLGEWLLNETKKEVLKIIKKIKIQPHPADLRSDANPMRLNKAEMNLIGEEELEKEALAAVKYAFLKIGIKEDMAFDFKESVSLEGNSGPYLLYTYARCQSVIKKSKFKNQKAKLQFKIKNYNFSSEEIALLRTIYKFPEVVEEAGRKYAPNLIANYLYELAGRFNTFYNKHRILETQNSKFKVQSLSKSAKTNNNSGFRLLLTKAVRQVLKNGLDLLGIETVEKM
jgi:arginyl-tRNA synthetase